MSVSSTSPAVGRSLDVLTYLAGRPGPVPGSAIVRDLQLPRSSTYHLLQVLIDRGFVVHYPEERTYALGVAAFEIGSAYLRHGPLEHLGRPLVTRLATRLSETAHLGILHGPETLYLLKEQPAEGIPVTLVTDVGVRLPASLTATGRSILAHLSPAQLRALFPDDASLVVRTGAGPDRRRDLVALLREERRRGWSDEDGFVTPGLRSVAACAFDHTGHPVAAFSMTWRRDRARTPYETVVAGVRLAARDLTAALSGVAPAGWF